jgi:hypothetical protein
MSSQAAVVQIAEEMCGRERLVNRPSTAQAHAELSELLQRPCELWESVFLLSGVVPTALRRAW